MRGAVSKSGLIPRWPEKREGMEKPKRARKRKLDTAKVNLKPLSALLRRTGCPPGSTGGQSMLARVGCLSPRLAGHLLCRSLSRFARRLGGPFGAVAHRQQRNELASNGRPKPCACIPPWTCLERAVIPLGNVVECRSSLRSVDRRLKEPHVIPQLLVGHRHQSRPKRRNCARSPNHGRLAVHPNRVASRW